MITAILKYFKQAIEIGVRLPPLFLMDMILKSQYSFNVDLTAWLIHIFYYVRNLFLNKKIETHSSLQDPQTFYFAFAALHVFGFICAVYSFLLTTKQLFSAYLSVASVAVIIWSYVMNVEYVKYCISFTVSGSSFHQELFAMNKEAIQLFFINYFLQAFLAIIFCFSSTSLPNFPPKKAIAGISFIFPTSVSIISLPDYILYNVPMLASVIEISFLVYYVFKHHREVYVAISFPLHYLSVVIDNHGVVYYVLQLYQSINVLQILKFFWCLRMLKEVFILFHNAAIFELRRTGFFTVTEESFFNVVEDICTQSCDTFLAVIGLTAILTSSIVFVLSYAQSLFCIKSNSRQNLAFIISLLFLTLAMQTGLTGLEPKERLLRLYRNIILVFAAASCCVHNDVDSALCSISTSQNASIKQHLKVLSGGILLIVYSCTILIFLHTKHSVSAWLVAASAYNIEIIIKVLISFSIHALNLIDARRHRIWENLDDYMFYLSSADHITYFLFNSFLFFNGCYILSYESFGITRIILMITHLYYNIIDRFKVGYIAYKKRSSIMKVVELLHNATTEQLENFDDVCSVCYQSLQTAVITSCNHFFHSVCLRKWLHEQNNCPVCHRRVSILLDHEHQD